MDRLGKLKDFTKVYIVDLSPSLLAVARERVKSNGWTNVEVVEADATTFVPPERKVDLVTMSYSLTMIPDWFLALENASKLLKPDGKIGIVDFYVSRKYSMKFLAQHSWFVRTFWQLWFAFDNVNLNADHLPYLLSHYQREVLQEKLAQVPYIPLLKVPYYIFLGKKK